MIYDISMTIYPGMVAWPGDPNVQMERVCAISNNDSCNVTRIKMGVHTGTHVDAPLHFIDDGDGIDRMTLEPFVGACEVVEVYSEPVITADLLASQIRSDCRRILVKTDNTVRREHLNMTAENHFDESFVALGPDAAAWIVKQNIQLVGVDYLSVEPFVAQTGNPVHQILLQNGVAILEGLDLRNVPAGADYEIFAAPIKIRGGDGAPCRALLRRI